MTTKKNIQPSVFLSDILVRDKNHLDFIRLIAAIAVIFGHSFYLFPTGGYQEPVTQIIEKNFTGTIAVQIFFFISGILIPQSFINSNSVWRYALMRIARIYPGALACLVLTVFIIGPITSSLSVTEYFSSTQTYCYLRDNWSFTKIFQIWFDRCETLPGVFTNNTYPYAVNGSLWTLYPEIVCYSYVFIFGCLGALKSRSAIVVIALAFPLLHAINPSLIPYFSDPSYSDILKVGCSFLIGTIAFAFKDQLPIRWQLVAPLAVCAIILKNTPAWEYFFYLTVFYSVLVLSASQYRGIKLNGDYSFGIYIYGFLIQQTLNHFFPTLTSYPSNLICIPLAIAMGYLSWHLIEKRAISLAKNL